MRRFWLQFQHLASNLLAAGLILCALVGSAASAGEKPGIVAPPLREVPKDRAIELRVLYLEDPRLPMLNAAQRKELLGKVEQLLQRWYGYRASLREVGHLNLAEYFTTHAGVFRKHPEIVKMALNPDRAIDRGRLRAVIKKALAPHPLAIIEGQLHAGKLESHEQAATLAYDVFLQRLRELRSIPLPDGSTLADPMRPELNSYMHWCALTHEMTEADLVFTNSMIVGADMEMGLTIISRGGVTAGNANANPHNAFQSAVVVTMFPFLSDAPFWLRERGPIPEAERLDVIATLTMHELGHMLLRTDHPVGHPSSCVYAPAVRLRYYDWHVDIRKNGLCPLPHRKLTSY